MNFVKFKILSEPFIDLLINDLLTGSESKKKKLPFNCNHGDDHGCYFSTKIKIKVKCFFVFFCDISDSCLIVQ